MKEIGVALIGHRFMGKAHSNAYRQVVPFMSPRLTPRMRVLCGRDGRAVAQAAKTLGWEEAATDRRAEVVKRKDIDRWMPSTPGAATPRSRSRRRAGRPSSARSRSPTTCATRGRCEGGGEGGRGAHALPQLPPQPRGDAGKA
jgi:hypothetical protein